MQGMFVFYAGLAVIAAEVYRSLPGTPASDAWPQSMGLTTARRPVYMLAELFGRDSFAGGFIVQSMMLALWLYQTFSLSLAAAGTLFFWTGVLTAYSYLVAAQFATRWGLDQHDGVHALAVELVPRRNPVRAKSRLRHLAPVRP